MEIDIALKNFDTLKSLPNGTKLSIVNKHELVHDNRWFTGIRRTVDGVSRNDMVKPLRETFTMLCNSDYSHSVTYDDMLNCLTHLETIFNDIYPNNGSNHDIYDALLFCKNYINWSKKHVPQSTNEQASESNDIIQNIQVPFVVDTIVSYASMDVEQECVTREYNIEPREPLIAKLETQPEIKEHMSMEEFVKQLDEIINDIRNPKDVNIQENDNLVSMPELPVLDDIRLTIDGYFDKLDKLRQETSKLFNNVEDKSQNQTSNVKPNNQTIRRRFVINGKYYGIQNYKFPSITNFDFPDTRIPIDTNSDIDDESDRDSDNNDVYTDDDNESDDGFINYPEKTCLEKLVIGVTNDMNQIFKATDNIFKRLSDVVNRYM